MDAAVEGAIAEGQIKGAVLAVGRGNDVVWERAYGVRRLGADGCGEPMTLDTIFDLASLTKVVSTAAALALLLEQGAVALDDPVRRHIPQWPHRDVTLRHLATHTSGFAAYIDAESVKSSQPDVPGDAAVLRAIAAHRLPYETGRGHRYSCLNYLLLARALEGAAGTDLEQYLRGRLWGPLGMTDTTYRVPPEDLPRCAPTESGLNGTVHDPLARLYGTGAHLPGNAGLFSTVRDLARFLGMLAAEGTWRGVRLLGPETARLLFSDQAPPGSGAHRALGWVIPGHEVEDEVYLPRKGRLTARSHGGFTGTFLWLDLESRVFLVLLSSRLYPDAKGDVLPLRRRLVRTLCDLYVLPEAAPPESGAAAP